MEAQNFCIRKFLNSLTIQENLSRERIADISLQQAAYSVRLYIMHGFLSANSHSVLCGVMSNYITPLLHDFAEESSDLWSAYILAQTEGDTGYDYNDAYDDDYDDDSGQVRLSIVAGVR